jgi:hypothetical protein
VLCPNVASAPIEQLAPRFGVSRNCPLPLAGRSAGHASRIPYLDSTRWLGCHMPAARLNRSERRSVQVIFRATPEDRDELKRRAQDAGCSVQAYIDRVLFGYADAQDLPSGRPLKRQEELPMTG